MSPPGFNEVQSMWYVSFVLLKAFGTNFRLGSTFRMSTLMTHAYGGSTDMLLRSD